MMLKLSRLSLNSECAVLHLAPERGLYSTLKDKVGRYVTGDINMARYSHIPDILEIDLCKPETYSDLGTFDIIIHNHVIEHLPCNYTAVLIRLHKLLNKGGVHLFSAPIYGAAFEEDLGEITEAEKQRRFGQFDHCRRFSAHDLDRTLGAIFDLPNEYDLETEFNADVLAEANIPDYARKGYSGHSVFCIQAEQILL